MKRQIRRNVFETNSSSMHSLVVKKTSEYYDESELRYGIWLDNGVWDIWNGDSLDFGRYPFKCLITFESKVKYAIASLCSHENSANAEKAFKSIAKVVYEMIPECTSIELPKDRYSKKEATYYGYVDETILIGFLKDEGITLKEFLTNKKYVVIVDGDEYCTWSKIKKSGLVNRDEIDSEYPARIYSNKDGYDYED